MVSVSHSVHHIREQSAEEAMNQAVIAGQNEITAEFQTAQSKRHIQHYVGSAAATLKGSKQSMTVIDAIKINAGTFPLHGQ